VIDSLELLHHDLLVVPALSVLATDLGVSVAALLARRHGLQRLVDVILSGVEKRQCPPALPHRVECVERDRMTLLDRDLGVDPRDHRQPHAPTLDRVVAVAEERLIEVHVGECLPHQARLPRGVGDDVDVDIVVRLELDRRRPEVRGALHAKVGRRVGDPKTRLP
jgi:hypothetical protein